MTMDGAKAIEVRDDEVEAAARALAGHYHFHKTLEEKIEEVNRTWQRYVGEARVALEAAAIRRNRHMHVSGTVAGKDKDTCAYCGLDLRHEVHMRT